MVTSRVLIGAAACILVGCAHGRARAPAAGAAPGDELTLYLDRAVVSQRIVVVVPPAARASVTARIPAGVDVEDVVVLDPGALSISELRGRSSAPIAVDAEPGDAATRGAPTEVSFEVGAPHAGTYVLHLGYLSDQLAWDAAYTMTATATHARATLRGAVAIRNSTGLTFPEARIQLVDATLGASHGHAADQLASALAARPAALPASAPAPRPLGIVALRPGETRIELLPDAAPRPIRSVLVYDPIGTALDHPTEAPDRDLDLGVTPPASSRVTESFEIDRLHGASEGLPAGPVRMLERRADGSLAVLGESRLFLPTSRVAEVDTVAIGTATGVTGKRARRDITIDEDHHRLTEEFVVTLTSTRPTPVEVVLREHLYRGQNWALAYRSIPEAAKEGAQQIAMRTQIPAHGEIEVLYVVVYTWEPPK